MERREVGIPCSGGFVLFNGERGIRSAWRDSVNLLVVGDVEIMRRVN